MVPRAVALKFITSDLQKYKKVDKLLDKTPQSLYWIGYILADGNVEKSLTRICFCLSNLDKERVELLHDYLGPTKDHEISTGTSKFAKNEHRKEHSVIRFMDSFNVPKICYEYGILPAKTYKGIDTKKIDDLQDSEFLSLFVGFVDGDGSVKRLNGREHFSIFIKLHESWRPFLEYCKYRIDSIFNKNTKAKINTYSGYPCLIISDMEIVSGIKRHITNNNINVLLRKWDAVPDNFVSRYTTTKILYAKINTLVSEGFKDKEIAEKLGINASVIRTKRYREQHAKK